MLYLYNEGAYLDSKHFSGAKFHPRRDTGKIAEAEKNIELITMQLAIQD